MADRRGSIPLVVLGTLCWVNGHLFTFPQEAPGRWLFHQISECVRHEVGHRSQHSGERVKCLNEGMFNDELAPESSICPSPECWATRHSMLFHWVLLYGHNQYSSVQLTELYLLSIYVSGGLNEAIKTPPYVPPPLTLRDHTTQALYQVVCGTQEAKRSAHTPPVCQVHPRSLQMLLHRKS